MHSRDLEVTALSIQTRRLVDEATALLENLRTHQQDLAIFVDRAHHDFYNDQRAFSEEDR
jgi:hypothetical protein